MGSAQPEARSEADGGAPTALPSAVAVPGGPGSGSAVEEEGVIFVLEKACLEVGNVGKVRLLYSAAGTLGSGTFLLICFGSTILVF